MKRIGRCLSACGIILLVLMACSKMRGEVSVDGPITVVLEYHGIGPGGIQLVSWQYVKTKDFAYVLHFKRGALQLMGMDRQSSGDAIAVPLPEPTNPLTIYTKAIYRIRGNILEPSPPLPPEQADKPLLDRVKEHMDKRAGDAEFDRLSPLEQLQVAGSELMEEQQLREVPPTINGLPTRILQPTYVELLMPEAGHAREKG